MCASFNGSPMQNYCSLLQSYITFWNELSSPVRHIPRNNVLIIGGDRNDQIGKDKNEFCLHVKTEMINILVDFSLLVKWVEFSLMVRETWVQSQVASYLRLLKWFLIPPCLTISNLRYVSRVKWSNLGKGVAPSSTPWCKVGCYWKGSLLVALDYGRQLYFYALILNFKKSGKIMDLYQPK